ncbi:MAG: F0F1 ATP synthase subunit alpha, partial [bacterium]|nr:F0F1 ATP synthase subunit alpha [bacterium]
MLRPEEISALLKSEIENYKGALEETDVGRVIKVGDSVATVYGLPGAKSGELLDFEGGISGMVMNLELETISCVLLGPDEKVKEGDRVTRTEAVIEVPVGPELLGRVVDPLGNPIDGKGPIRATKR